MKPHELIEGLRLRENLREMDLARRLDPANPKKMQPKLHRYLVGETLEPERSLGVPLARYFGLPEEAIYNEDQATRIAKERGIAAPPPRPPREQKTDKRVRAEEFVLLCEQIGERLGEQAQQQVIAALRRRLEAANDSRPAPLEPGDPRDALIITPQYLGAPRRQNRDEARPPQDRRTEGKRR